MRLDPDLVHPSIFRASDEILFAGDPEGDAFGTWLKENAWIFMAMVMGTVVAMIPLLRFAAGQPKPVKIAIVFSLLGILAAATTVAFSKSRRFMSLEKLEALLPGAKLSETQRAYGHTIVALGKAGQPQYEIQETMRALNALLDEESHLLATRARLTGTDDQDERAHLAAERERLAAKTAAARDSSARAAFEQSLGLLDERLTSLDTQGTHLERIDAHLELLRQAVLATRDAARRLNGGAIATAPDLATDSLRSAVALARAQTQATEQALAELRAF